MNRRKKRMKETAAIAVLYLILVIALLMLIFVGAEAKETEPASCEYCPLCTQDGDCIAMGGDSLFDFLPPDAQYFPNGWKCDRCPLIDLTDDGKIVNYRSTILKLRSNFEATSKC